MSTLDKIEKTRQYLDYLEKHIHNIKKAWNYLQEKCKDMRFIHDDFVFFSIDGQVEYHDISKLSEHEFVQYRRHFYPCNEEDVYDIKEAWEHHKKENPHHWQHWTNKEYYHPYELEINCVHMIIDWMAMGYVFGDTPQKYYESNKNKIKLPQHAIDFIYEIFKRI